MVYLCSIVTLVLHKRCFSATVYTQPQREDLSKPVFAIEANAATYCKIAVPAYKRVLIYAPSNTQLLLTLVSELTVEVERLKKRLVELRGYGRKHSQNPSNVEMLTIQEKLRNMDEHFYKDHSIDPRKPLTISGFPMPLQCEEDVDRLELMVNRNPKIRAQYVSVM